MIYGNCLGQAKFLLQNHYILCIFRTLQAFEVWIWRRIERISWTDKVSNEKVLRRVGEEWSLTEMLERRRKNWIRQMLRGNGLLREVWKEEWKGKGQEVDRG